MVSRVTTHLSVALSVYNLLDRRDYDIEYYYVSQLRGEAVHAHSMESRSFRGSLSYYF